MVSTPAPAPDHAAIRRPPGRGGVAYADVAGTSTREGGGRESILVHVEVGGLSVAAGAAPAASIGTQAQLCVWTRRLPLVVVVLVFFSILQGVPTIGTQGILGQRQQVELGHGVRSQ